MAMAAAKAAAEMAALPAMMAVPSPPPSARLPSHGGAAKVGSPSVPRPTGGGTAQYGASQACASQPGGSQGITAQLGVDFVMALIREVGALRDQLSRQGDRIKGELLQVAERRCLGHLRPCEARIGMLEARLKEMDAYIACEAAANDRTPRRLLTPKAVSEGGRERPFGQLVRSSPVRAPLQPNAATSSLDVRCWPSSDLRGSIGEAVCGSSDCHASAEVDVAPMVCSPAQAVPAVAAIRESSTTLNRSLEQSRQSAGSATPSRGIVPRQMPERSLVTMPSAPSRRPTTPDDVGGAGFLDATVDAAGESSGTAFRESTAGSCGSQAGATARVSEEPSSPSATLEGEASVGTSSPVPRQGRRRTSRRPQRTRSEPASLLQPIEADPKLLPPRSRSQAERRILHRYIARRREQRTARKKMDACQMGLLQIPLPPDGIGGDRHSSKGSLVEQEVVPTASSEADALCEVNRDSRRIGGGTWSPSRWQQESYLKWESEDSLEDGHFERGHSSPSLSRAPPEQDVLPAPISLSRLSDWSEATTAKSKDHMSI